MSFGSPPIVTATTHSSRRLAWGTLGYITATASTTGWSTSTVRSSILARSSGKVRS